MKINKKLIFSSTLSTSLLVTGCLSKTIQVNRGDDTNHPLSQSIKKLDNSKIDCPNKKCIALLTKPKSKIKINPFKKIK